MHHAAVHRRSSIAIQHKGISVEGVLKSEWLVVPDSGTDELRGLRGEGTYINKGEPRTSYTLDYYFD